MTPLGAIPVLGTGWVRLASASPSAKELSTFCQTYRRAASENAVHEIVHVVVEMKVPAITLLSMGRIRHQIHPVDSLKDAWVPNEADVQAKDLETGRDIAASIKATTDAQLANQSLYVQDGCNGWVAKTTTPLSAYVTVYAYGSLSEWLDFIHAVGAPPQVKAYQDAVEGILRAEYPAWNTFRRR